jgi:uncharacterized protein (DUF1501 family)
VVFLRGGYDAANVVVPVASDFYYESRPTIAIPRPDPNNPRSGRWGGTKLECGIHTFSKRAEG